jgi:hypothetical protein
LRRQNHTLRTCRVYNIIIIIIKYFISIFKQEKGHQRGGDPSLKLTQKIKS